PEQLRPESKDLGEAATFISHSSKDFIHNQGAARPAGIPSPLPPSLKLWYNSPHRGDTHDQR
ncbi:MAG: hypothetical protein U0I99_04345, partial [Dialister sp.]|nr:hypothetical protein [Dialister sp.]